MYEASIQDPARFWGEHGKRIDWIKPYSPGAVRDVDYTVTSTSAGTMTAC